MKRGNEFFRFKEAKRKKKERREETWSGRGGGGEQEEEKKTGGAGERYDWNTNRRSRGGEAEKEM